jgi:hypothetical protein
MEYIILIAAIILLIAVEFLDEIRDVVLLLRHLVKRGLEGREKAEMRAYWVGKGNRTEGR